MTQPRWLDHMSRIDGGCSLSGLGKTGWSCPVITDATHGKEEYPATCVFSQPISYSSIPTKNTAQVQPIKPSLEEASKVWPTENERPRCENLRKANVVWGHILQFKLVTIKRLARFIFYELQVGLKVSPVVCDVCSLYNLLEFDSWS